MAPKLMFNSFLLVFAIMIACSEETVVDEIEEEQVIEDDEITQPEEDQTGNGLAKNYLFDEDILLDSAVLFASDFEKDFNGWSKHNPNISKIIANPDLAFSGNRVLKSTATKGVNEGGDVDYNISPGQDKIYLRFYTKFDESTVTPHHFVKIRAFQDGFWTNAGQRPPGDKGFWTGIEPTSSNTWYFYTYWHEMHSWQSKEGNTDGRANPYYGNNFNVPDQTPFKKGDWICVEAMLKANSTGKNDGEQAFWINGVKIGHWKKGEPRGAWANDKFIIGDSNSGQFEGFNWRTSKNLKINQIALQWYVSAGRMDNAIQDDNSVFFDNVVIATKYIGPMYNKNGPVLKKN
jgi:hypothetical protein